MRSRSLKEDTNEGMEIDKLSGIKLKAEPQLSGAYIRSLVKQLTSSTTKEAMNPKGRGFCGGSDGNQNISKLGEKPEIEQPQQLQPHKKQVRRRLHTSRPYQERLLNMAEARREIVTALKFHRAAMKQANEQKQQEEQGQQQLVSPVQIPNPQPCFEPEEKIIKSRKNPRIYPSNKENHSCYFDSLNCASFSYPPPPPPPPLPEVAYPFPWHTSPIFPPIMDDTLNFPLPNQTLGLNLNFQGFTNIETTLFQNNTNPSPVYYSSSSPSSSSSPPLSIATEELPSAAKDLLPPPAASEPYGGGGLHQVMDDDEMAEIRSLGEQHQMEWNDTMNLATSAWWFKFLKTMEINPDEVKDENSGFHPYDEFLELPANMDSSDVFDFSSKDLLYDLDLPCMDIGDIDGMDGDWLA